MKKQTPKEQAILCHKVASLMSLLSDYTDELYPDSPIAAKFKKHADEIMPMAHELLESLYQMPEIGKTTYLSDLAAKMDTVMRKNYQRILT